VPVKQAQRRHGAGGGVAELELRAQLGDASCRSRHGQYRQQPHLNHRCELVYENNANIISARCPSNRKEAL
jgi:hypothetical protein